MQVPSSAFEKISLRLFRILCSILFLFLIYYSFRITGYSESAYREEIYFLQDSPVTNLLGICGFLLIISILAFIAKKAETAFHFSINLNRAALAVSILIAAASCYWVYASSTAPQYDQYYIYTDAIQFNLGDFSSLDAGGYEAQCPQQLGLATFLRLILALGGSYVTFQYVVAVFNGIFTYSSFRVAMLLSQNSRLAGGCSLLASLFCIPLVIYTPFVYGDSISSSLIMFSAWMLLCTLDRFSFKKIVLFGLSTASAILLRANTLIVLIAFVIVLAIKCISSAAARRNAYCLLASALLCVGISQFGLKTYYSAMNPERGQSIPAILYVAMGMNWDYQNPGYFNGYNQDTFRENHFDSEASTAAAKEYIQNRLQDFSDNPSYAVSFYKQKFVYQWEVPMYQCRYMNNNIVGRQSALAVNAYFGPLGAVLEQFMNLYQLLIYGSVLFFLCRAHKLRPGIETDVLLIAVFGGFLFSMLWEAKARYVFPYFLFMLPCAAVGITLFLTEIKKRISRK